MVRGHTPFGYRIQNGRAVLCDSEVQQIKGIYSGYLSGLCYIESAERVGLNMKHGSVKRLMRNRHCQSAVLPVIPLTALTTSESSRIRTSPFISRRRTYIPQKCR